ncbi:MAG: NADH-quinone oxidoreductase subunit C [Anaerolineaceae bacterium]|nr:NADH-quinone oxidoreductase subunit C [Anaerolineaceae bacterium]
MKEDEVITRLKEVAGEAVTVREPINRETVYTLPVEKWLDVAAVLAGELGITHLSAITAQQRDGSQPEVEVMYHFWHNRGITFVLTLPADAPEIPSIVTIIPGADFYEREAAEMFGITFTGRESTPHLLLPDDWDQGPPFTERKTYD